MSSMYLCAIRSGSDGTLALRFSRLWLARPSLVVLGGPTFLADVCLANQRCDQGRSWPHPIGLRIRPRRSVKRWPRAQATITFDLARTAERDLRTAQLVISCRHYRQGAHSERAGGQTSRCIRICRPVHRSCIDRYRMPVGADKRARVLIAPVLSIE